MDYSNFVRNFYRYSMSRLADFRNYYGKFVNLNKGLDIPSEFMHEEEYKNMFLPTSVLNINAPTKYFVDFMNYYVNLMPDLGVVFANKDRINDLYNNVVNMGIIEDDSRAMEYIEFVVNVGIKVLVEQGILEK